MLGMTNPTEFTEATDTTAPIHSQPLQHSLFSQLTARAGWLLPAIPEPVLRIFGSRTNSHGDRLDSDVRASSLVTDLMHPADYSHQSVKATRAVVEDAAYMAGGHVTQVGSVVEERIRGVRVRHYRPTGAVSPDEDLPTLVYFHGGGWILGDKDTHDRLVRELAKGAKAAVVYPNYTPSPEAQYPVPLEQAYAAMLYIIEHADAYGLDPSRIAVAGDSVGGNMATVMTLLAKERKGPEIAFQLLLYPVTDANFDTESYRTFAEGPWLTREAMKWFWDAYAPDARRRGEITASPLRATPEQLAGLPPAMIITAENDVLRDEGEAYARKLIEAGVHVACVRYNNTHHDFMMLNALAETTPTRAAVAQAAAALKKMLH